LAEALALEPRENAEGLVVRLVAADIMLKIKQEDYVHLHRLITGLNERKVWEYLGPDIGMDVDGVCEMIPEEFHPWVREVATELILQSDQVAAEADWIFQTITTLLDQQQAVWDPREYRKAFAARAQEHPGITSYLFQLLDGRDIRPAIWRNIKPEVSRTLLAITEDNA
jgi:RNA ligase